MQAGLVLADTVLTFQQLIINYCYLKNESLYSARLNKGFFDLKQIYKMCVTFKKSEKFNCIFL